MVKLYYIKDLIMNNKFERNALLKEVQKNNDNKLIDLSLSIIKKIKNKELFTSSHSTQAEGYSDQDIKSMIIERAGKLSFKDRSLIAKGLIMTSGVGVSAKVASSNFDLKTTTSDLFNQAIAGDFLQTFQNSHLFEISIAALTVLYATHIISKVKDRNISEESIVKKLFEESGSYPELETSFKQAIYEHNHSSFGNFWANINKKSLFFIENSKELLHLSKKILTEAPKSLMNHCISYITGKENKLKFNNNNDYKKVIHEGTMYNQFFTDLNTNIKDIAKDKKLNKEIDKAIQKHYETVIKKTYEDMLVLNISQFTKQYILDLLEDKNGSKYDKLKSLNDISQLSKVVSNNPLNKYTLISNIAKNFLDKYSKLSDSQFSLLADNSQQALQDIIQEESELIKFNFKDQPDIIQGNFNVLFSNTLSSEKPLFKDIFKKHKEILIQEENEISELKSKNARKRTEHL